MTYLIPPYSSSLSLFLFVLLICFCLLPLTFGAALLYILPQPLNLAHWSIDKVAVSYRLGPLRRLHTSPNLSLITPYRTRTSAVLLEVTGEPRENRILPDMANTAQCYYCFETLLASFEDREPPTLAAVEALWEQHEQTKKLSSLEEQLEVEDTGQQQTVNEQDEDDDSNQSTQSSNQPKKLQLPRISRLQSQFSTSSSAATSSSSASNTSSNSLQSSSTNITTPSAVSETPQLRSPDQRYPLFVTWNTLSRSGHKSLRGCIGTFEGQELAAGLKSYALTSYVVPIEYPSLTTLQRYIPIYISH